MRKIYITDNLISGGMYDEADDDDDDLNIYYEMIGDDIFIEKNFSISSF